jgi:hypothetical protein
MPRKKNTQSDPTKLSPIEQKAKAINLENESLDKALKEKKKRLDELERLNAQERLLTAGDPDPEAEGSEEGGAEGPSRFFPRNLGIGGGGVLRGEPRNPEQAEEFMRKQEDFERKMAEFVDTDGRVHVYRLKDGNNWAKMGSYSAKDWGGSLETVAKKFGGGTFKVRLHAPNGEFAGEQIVEYDEEAYPKPAAIAALVPVQNNNNSDMLKIMMEMQATMHRETQAQMANFMQTMAGVMGNKASLVSSVQDLAMFKEMFTDKTKVNPMDNMNTLLTVLQQGMNLGAQTAPPEGEGGLISKLLGSFLTGENLNRVGDIMRTVVTAPQAPAPAPAPQAQPQRQLPPPAPKPAANPNPTVKEGDNGMNLVVMAYKPIIMGYAKTKQNPKKTAEIIVSRIAAIKSEWLLIVDDFLKLPDTKEKFVYAYAPELKEYDAWVVKVMKEMSMYIKELMDEAEEEAGNSGDAAPAEKTAPTGSEVPPAQ